MGWKKKHLLFVLCFLGGLVGLHYYVVGRFNRGIIYTMTLGLLGIGWLYDLFKIALGVFEDRHGCPID